MTMRLPLAALAAALVLTLSACQPDATPVTETTTAAAGTTDSAPPKHEGLMVSAPWSRPLAPGATVAAGYFELMNHSGQQETLVAARAEGVGRVEIHDIVNVDEVMKMRPLVGGLVLDVDGMATLQPSGRHLMFFDVTRTWAEGETVPVTLVFASGKEVLVDFSIGAPAAAAAAAEHAHHNH